MRDNNNRISRNGLYFTLILCAFGVLFTGIQKLRLIPSAEDFGSLETLPSFRHQLASNRQETSYEHEKILSLEQEPLIGYEKSYKKSTTNLKKPSSNHNKQKQRQSEIAGLSCEKYGEPISQNLTSEMIYWHDITSDTKYVSPYRYHGCSLSSQHEKEDDLHNEKRNRACPVKYITYELSPAGWNNRRMVFENMLAMAFATGRTLVLPPKSTVPLLTKGWNSTNHTILHNDIYPLDMLNKEYKGIDIISMEEFLEREALTGNLMLKNSTGESNVVLFPPDNQTVWKESTFADGKIEPLNSYLQRVGYVSQIWNPQKCVAAIATKPGNASASSMKVMMDEILLEQDGRSDPKSDDYHGKTVPVDASPRERLQNILGGRKELCLYDEEMQNSKLLHFHYNATESRRVFGHFYAFFFFEDWKLDLLVKRMIRDHVRYRDEIVCAAARVVGALRERSQSRNTTQTSNRGEFDTFHIRRGDFIRQYTFADVSVDKIYSRTNDVLAPNATVYIATDEKNKAFFNPLREHYDICFLDDFQDLLVDVSPAIYGMIDQLVAARGRTFVGVSFSTYTNYINRLRGYYSTKQKTKGYEDGVLNSYHYSLKSKKTEMRIYHSIYGPHYWGREFPVAWVDIDKGIGK